MRKFRGWMARFGGLFNRQRKDRDFDAEIESHLELHVDENLRSGMSPEDARRLVIIKLGGVESMKEAYRDQRGLPFMEMLVQDLRFGLRMLFKNPGFTAVAVFTLALGIGANSVVFGVAKAILFRPLGIEEPERVVWLNLVDHGTGEIGERFSWTDFTDLGAEAASFEHLALVAWPGVTWERGDRVEQLASIIATPGLFDVLRIRPLLGRSLVASDAEPAAAPVAMISHEFWQTRLAGNTNILGQTLRLDGKLWTVVGILPPHLEFPIGHAPALNSGTSVYAGVHDVWLPHRAEGEDRTERGRRMDSLIGRLRPGVAVKTARMELASIGKRRAADFPDTNRGLTIETTAYRDKALGSTRTAIDVLALAVAAVLLICCVNLANLLLARGVSRQWEMAIRQALGAGRGRIARALMMESLLLSLAGGLLGIVFAEGAVLLIRRLGPAEVPFIGEVVVDGTVMGLTIGLCFATALVFGLLPALWHSRIEAAEVLKSGARSSAGPQIRAWQQAFLVGQIALVMVLLSSGGLLLESFRRLMGVDLGYQPGEVIAVDLENWGIPTNADAVRLFRQIKSRLAALSGVEAVGTIQSTPLTGKWTPEEKAQVFGRPLPLAEQPSLAVTFVAFDYFRAMGIPLISGRLFRDAELMDDGYAPISILNETAAAKLFPGESALGKRFSIGSSPERYYKVVGIVKDTRDVRLEQRPQPRFYLLYAYGGAQVIVRSAVSADALIPLLHDTLQRFSPHVIVQSIKPMATIVSDSVSERRLLMEAFVAYALVALGVAGGGVFGVAAYQVAHRTREFGVRLALGADPANLAWLVLAHTGRLAVVGLAIGLFLSLGVNRLLANQLFDLSPNDPLLLATVGLVLLLTGLLASFLPARRAAKVDPMVALANE
jgi:predicted permease